VAVLDEGAADDAPGRRRPGDALDVGRCCCCCCCCDDDDEDDDGWPRLELL
jgi:hypothetical protein